MRRPSWAAYASMKIATALNRLVCFGVHHNILSLEPQKHEILPAPHASSFLQNKPAPLRPVPIQLIITERIRVCTHINEEMLPKIRAFATLWE